MSDKRTPGAVTPTSPDNLPELAPEHTLSGTRAQVGGLFDLAHETVGIQMGAMDTTAARESMEKLVAFMEFVKRLAFSTLKPHDFVRFSTISGDSEDEGEPWLTGKAAEKVAEICGINFGMVSLETDSGEDTEGPWYARRATLWFSLGARRIEAVGEVDSRDGMFSKGGILTASKVPRARVGQKAITRAKQNGISAILGLRNMSWERVMELTGQPDFDISAVKSASFQKGGQGGGGKSAPKAGCVPKAQVRRVFERWCKMAGLNSEDFKGNIGAFSDWIISVLGESANRKKWDSYTADDIKALDSMLDEIPG